MPLPSPFHERTAPLCISHKWKDWAGYHAVRSFDHSHEREYMAFRHAAGLLDVTPLYKYDVRGPDAAAFLSRVMVKDISKLGVGRVTYTCWCDDLGKVIDDGTITRLEPDFFRVTAADPSLHWLAKLSRGYDVTLEDTSAKLAAVAIQGPTSRAILADCSSANLDKLKFFRATRAKIDDLDVIITRTGYTGDLGYEVWVEAPRAVRLWDALMSAGKAHGLIPAGLDALDMTRIEAGFIMLGVEYFSAPKVVLESRKSTPYELGLGWTIDLERDPFVGQAALQAEKTRGSEWQMVGLEVSWEELERLYDGYGLPPSLPAEASRSALPIYVDRQHVGQVTSHTWSPTLKRSIGLATIRTPHAALGNRVYVEHTVEYERRTVAARVVETPFFNPERKRKP